jgi:hypothetical protein
MVMSEQDDEEKGREQSGAKIISFMKKKYRNPSNHARPDAFNETIEASDEASAVVGTVIKNIPELPKDYPFETFYDDDPPGVDPFDECYLKSRSDLINQAKARECSVEELEKVMEMSYAYGCKDHITPCGVYNDIADTYLENYRRTKDVEVLIAILKKHPIYGIPVLNDEVIRLLRKERIKPISDEVHKREDLHHDIKYAFYLQNPLRGEVDAAYTEIAEKFNINFNSVKTIISRARKRGWYNQLPNFHLDKVSSDDRD